MKIPRMIGTGIEHDNRTYCVFKYNDGNKKISYVRVFEDDQKIGILDGETFIQMAEGKALEEDISEEQKRVLEDYDKVEPQTENSD